jgi:uncharacterized protein (TIGR03435 family)
MLCGAATVLLGQDLPSGVKPSSMPDFPPSYEVHVAPSSLKVGTSGNSGPNYWSASGYDLRSIIEKVYHLDRSRIDLSPSLEDGTRYDFAVVLPKPEGQEEIERLVQRTISEKFRIVATSVSQAMDVYVLTAPHGETAGLRAARSDPEDIISSSSSSVEVAISSTSSDARTSNEVPPELLQALDRGRGVISSVRGISISGGTMEQFCRDLEMGLDRPVIDETGLKGVYDLEVRSASSTEEFFARLRDQLGLVLTPGRRDVRMLAVRPK